MTVTEHLMRPGNGTLTFKDDLPTDVALTIASWLPEKGPGFSVVVFPANVDAVALGDTAALAKAMYTGRVDSRPDRHTLEFSGLGTWLDTYVTPAVSAAIAGLATGSPTEWLTALLLNGLTVGTVSGGSNVLIDVPPFLATHRELLDKVSALGGWEYRINPNGTVDAGVGLFATPNVIVTADAEGRDGIYTGVDGELLDQNIDTAGVATEMFVLGGGGTGPAIVQGHATKSTTLLSFAGAAPSIVAVMSSPTDADPATIDAVATSTLNLQSASRSVQVSSRTPMIRTLVAPGDGVYLFNPETGLTDLANRLDFRGESQTPTSARLLSLTWPIEAPHFGVWLRSNAGAWLDVTTWVAPESGEATWVVGDWTPDNYGRTNRSDPAIEEKVTVAPYKVVTSTVTGSVGAWESTGTQPNQYTITFEYSIVDGWCEGVMNATAGATFTPGTGTYQWQHPVTNVKPGRATNLCGTGRIKDNSVPSVNNQLVALIDDAGQITLRYSKTPAASGLGVDTTVGVSEPMVWAANDRVEIFYRFPLNN